MASYEYWRAALANPEILKDRTLRLTLEPELGFFRDKSGAAIAIWEEDGELIITRNSSFVPPDRYENVWTSCASRPVPEEWYHAHEDGAPWPDVDSGLAGMGDNIRSADEVEQIDMLNDEVKKYGQIEDDNTAAQAISLRARLLELKGVVDKKREEQKAPHLKAAREVDEIWMGPVKRATAAANTLSALVSAWETRKRRLAREAEEAAERARLEAELADRPPPKPAPSPVPEPRQQIKAGYGRAASVREKLVVVGIGDQDAAFKSVGLRNEVQAAMVKEAQKAIDAGAQGVPGFIAELQALIR